MTFQQFDEFFDGLIAECRQMRDTKGKEYAHCTDRFANFNRLAQQLEISNVQIGWIYGTKHLDSIVSFLKTGQIHSTESIRGRFVDAITYLALIAGMIQERQNLNNDDLKVMGIVENENANVQGKL